MNAIYQVVAPWVMDSDSDDLIQLRDHLIWLQKELFDQYEPNRYRSFDDQVSAWLDNVTDVDDRKTLFRLIDHIFFVGKQQFDSLCRCAYGSQTVRWLIDQGGLDLADPLLNLRIDADLQNTWFCPITDSMRINSFLKLNGHPGHDHRPEWRALEVFADPDKVRHYVKANGITRIVLLEDFVGSGKQIEEVIPWAATVLPTTPILVIPLVCCPDGIQKGAELSAVYGNVSFSPTLALRSELFLVAAAQQDEPALFARVRDLILRVATRLGIYSHSPFGFMGTGALVALYSNCPDNTLPIVHHRESRWEPLFTRIRRS